MAWRIAQEDSFFLYGEGQDTTSFIGVNPTFYLTLSNFNQADIIIDSERSHLVRKLFEEYAKGEYSFTAMAELAKKIGLKNSRGNKGNLCRTHIDAMLKDPFYHGVMHVKSRNEFYPHRYETIISKELFDQCQAVRSKYHF